MKKLIALLFVASIGASLIGCNKASTDDSSTAPATGGSKIKDKTPNAGGDE